MSIVIAVLIHALIFLAFWLTNLPYQESLNNFLIGLTGWRANYLLVFMLFAGLIELWSGARLVGRKNLRWTGPSWLFYAIGIFFLVFFYGSFIVLFIKNLAQLYRLGQLFQYFRLFIDAAILLALAWFLPRWVKAMASIKKIVLPTGLLVLWLIPVFLVPGNVYRGALSEKPRLIGHRGAATLAPENTLTSMRTAANLGVYGLETDISVSQDGVPFLMHDETLARTTDVARVFPGRKDSPAENFTWAELSALDAGSWMPGWDEPPEELIPTLDEMLQVVRDDHLHFIYDLRIPSAEHPYANKALELTLQAIQKVGVTDRTWVLAKPSEISTIRSILPEAILAYGIGYTDLQPAPAALISSGYKVVNSVYGLSASRIHAYQQAGLWVNLWVVDEPWQYSRLWLIGADSVTSNYVQTFVAITRPVLAMPFPLYLGTWEFIGLLMAILFRWSSGEFETALG